MDISFLSTRSYRTRANKSISFSFLLLFKRYILLDSDKVMGDHAVLNSEGVCLLSRCSSLALFIKISLYLDTSLSRIVDVFFMISKMLDIYFEH